jgi:hypothetical protein
MPRFRKKPVIVEAVRFTGSNVAEVAALLDWEYEEGSGNDDSLVIETLNGDVTVSAGEWIVKGVAGEGYPCRADIFIETYDPVDDEGES